MVSTACTLAAFVISLNDSFRVALCALAEDCIAPNGHNLVCQFKDRFQDYGYCHRYDQSAMSLVRLHLLFLSGYYTQMTKEVHYSSASENNATAEVMKEMMTEWDKRLEPFASCFVSRGGNYYDGWIATCNNTS